MASSSEPMAMPEPMNASPHHSKVKVSITLADRLYVAGGFIGGKVEMECRADKGLGIGVIMIELLATQELTSRDHSATSTFIHSKRIFQGPGLPPSNAVQAHPLPDCPILPPSYYQAKRGSSTFLFRIPVPEDSLSSINFGSGLAKVRYELRATVGVVWKGDRRLVVDKHVVDVVAGYPYEEIVGLKAPEGVVIGENGKFWVHGKLVGPVVIAGESACIELHVKNHSNKKNTGLSLSLNRTLVLPGSSRAGKQALELTDTLTHVPFRGPEYIVPPGAEGVANLVFDVPKHSRGVRAGTLEGDEVDPPRHTESLFEIRCTVDIKMTMGFGNKDLMLSVPVTIVHPKVVPPNQPAAPANMGALPYPPQALPSSYGYEIPYPIPHPYASPSYPALAMSPPPAHPPWVSPTLASGIPLPMSPQPYQVYQPPPDIYAQQLYQQQQHRQHQQHYRTGSPPSQTYMAIPPIAPYLVRPSSAGGNVSLPDPYTLPAAVPSVSGLPPPSSPHHFVHPAAVAQGSPQRLLSSPQSQNATQNENGILPPVMTVLDSGAEEGKGQRASRVSHHLRVSSRTRSVSPQSHRFPILPSSAGQQQQQQAVAGASPMRARGLPQIPGQLAGTGTAVPSPMTPTTQMENVVAAASLSPTAPRAGAVVYSPRPQLTPKHSFSNDVNARPKSERVEELERMAGVIALATKDLSGDIPKDDVLRVLGMADGGKVTKSQENGNGNAALGVVHTKSTDSVEMNKTLPPPPVPTRKKGVSPLSLGTPAMKPGIDSLFDPPGANRGDSNKLEHATPLLVPAERTPRTPTLSALLPTRYPRIKASNNFLGVGEEKNESGLDALERKLLAQVGTRKFEDEVGITKKNERPDVRYVMGIGANGGESGDLKEEDLEVVGGRRVSPIDIPVKLQSLEPLNDSAISSLTLGNHGVDDALDNDRRSVDGDVNEVERAGLGVVGGGNDSDVEVKTHRGGSVFGDDDGHQTSWAPPMFPLVTEEESRTNLKLTTRHRREEAADTTAFRGSTPTKLSDGSGKSGKSKDKERRSGKKRDRGNKEERTKTRSEAKGRVAAWLGRIDPEHPPEEEVIPPSPSVVLRPDIFLSAGKSVADVTPPVPAAISEPAAETEKIHEEKDVSTAPNPRSSGFMPVGTPRRETMQKNHPARDITVVEESRKIADLWAAELPPSKNLAIPPAALDQTTPKIPVTIPSGQAPRSVRLHEEAKIPSKLDGDLGSRNVWQLPQPVSTIRSSEKSPPPVPVKSTAVRLLATPNKSSDPEVKYDVRSARGGRGGKVASVTAMWASVASGISTSQSQGSTSGKIIKTGETRLNHNGRFAPGVSSQPSTKSGPHLPGKIALPGLASNPVGNGRKPSANLQPARSVPVPSRQETSKPKLGLNHAEPGDTPASPRVPKKPSATRLHLSKPVESDITTSKSTEPLNNSPAPGLFAGDFKTRTPGKTTPTINLSTASSGGSRPVVLPETKPKINGGVRGGLPPVAGAKPVIKSTSVPAVISSSHAIPMLSSTASLARPAGTTTAAPRLTAGVKTSVAGGSSSGKPEAGDNHKPKVARAFGASVPVKSGLGAVSTLSSVAGSSSLASPSKSPPPDLAFGQARLRDLIRKYQTQAS